MKVQRNCRYIYIYGKITLLVRAERNSWEYLGAERKIILKGMLNKFLDVVQTEFLYRQLGVETCYKIGKELWVSRHVGNL
jgi:hypothetical protein